MGGGGLGRRVGGPGRWVVGGSEDGGGARETGGGAWEAGGGVREAGRGGGSSGGAVHETLSCRTLCAFLPGKLVESDVHPRELHRAERPAAAGRTVDGSADIRLL